MIIQIYILIGIWTAVVALTFMGTWMSLRYHRKLKLSLERDLIYYPPISILKPMKNYEEGLSESIESFFNFDYPDYEIIFCVSSENDPVVNVTRHLISQYPKVKARLLCGDARVGFNPKVANLMKGYDQSSYDWVLISDSNVRVKSDYLKNLASYIYPGVGLVTSMIAGRNASNFWGRVECSILNTHYSRWGIILDAFGVPVISGKEMLFQKSVVDRFGGLLSTANYLAEDFIFGQRIKKLGLKVVVTHESISQFVGSQSMKSFLSRHIRWGRIRKRILIWTFLLELLINSFISGVLGGWALSHLLGVAFLPVFCLHMALWFLCDLLLILEVEGSISIFDPICWLVREFLAIPIWFIVIFGNTVDWRGQRLSIRADTLLEKVGAGSDKFSKNIPLGSRH